MALTKITSDVISTGAIESGHIASGAISSGHLTGITTDNVSEGSSNTYFTNARARGSVSVTGSGLSYDSSTGVIQIGSIANSTLTNSSLTVNSNSVSLGGSVTLDTDDIGEGSSNLYFTNARAQGAISGSTGVTVSGGAISIGQDVATSSTPTFGNITTTGYIAGPATFTIDPAAVGDNTGTLVIAGNLQVDGTTTTINSTTMTVDDLNITLASGAANASAANGAGITVDGASATITYDGTNDKWDFNKDINVSGVITSKADGAVNDAQTGRLNFTNTNSNASSNPIRASILAGRQNSAWGGYLSLYTSTGTDAATEKVRIGETGNVGITNASPNAQLHIGSANATGDTTNPALQIGGTTTYRLGLYTSAEGGVIENKNGDDGIQFRVKTAGDAMRIDGGTGNVGIGTSSPAESLHTTGNIRFGDSAPAELYTNSSELRLGVDRNNDNGTSNITFYVNNSETARIDSSGRLLLGQTSNDDGSAVQIDANDSGSTVYSLRVENSNTATDVYNAIRLIQGASGSAVGVMATGGSTTGNASYRNVFHVGTQNATSLVLGTNDTERMRIDSSGLVGIGTTSPSEALHVYHATGNINAIIESGDANAYLAFKDNSTSSNASVFLGASANDMTFFAGGTSECMRIDSSGNVGIGRTSIAQVSSGATTLAIQGTSNGKGGAIRLYSANDTISAYIYPDTNGLSINTNSSVSGTRNDIYFRTAAAEAMRIDSSGNVGIGETNPSYKLHLSGPIADQQPLILGTVTGTPSASFNWVAEYMAANLAQDKRIVIALGKARGTNNSATISYVQRADANNNAIAFGHFGNNDLVNFTYNGNVGIGTASPAALLHISKDVGSAEFEALRLSNSDPDMANYQANHAVSLSFELPAYNGGNRDSKLAGKIVGLAGAGGTNDWYTNGASSNFQGQLDFYTRNDDVLTKHMTLDEHGDLTIPGSTQGFCTLEVGRTGTGGQGQGIINIKSQGASKLNFFDVATNTISLFSHSVNLRIKDVPNGDDSIQFGADGNLDADGQYRSNGVDYAEYFESTDGTAIPVGTSVVLVNEKVRAATSGEQPLGVVRPGESGSSVIGGSAGLAWTGKYLKDDYDAYLYDTVDYWTWKDVGDTNNTGDEDQQCWSDRVPSGWTVPSDKVVTSRQRKRLNPDFVENLDADGNQIYVNREERDEWNCIGLLGQVPITKGQVTNSNWTKLKDRSATVELWFIK